MRVTFSLGLIAFLMFPAWALTQALAVPKRGRPSIELGKIDQVQAKLNRQYQILMDNEKDKSSVYHAIQLNDLALSYQALGDFAKAEQLFRKALPLFEKSRIELQAICLNNLGVLYHEKGDLAKADALLRLSLELLKQNAPLREAAYSQCLNDMAALFADMGDYSQADTFYRQALALREKYPLEHATILHNLGLLLEKAGKPDQAVPLLQEDLKITGMIRGKEHPDYAHSLESLAYLYSTLNEYPKAEPLYRQALEIYENKRGRKHPAYARTLNNLGFLLTRTGRLSEAETALTQALMLRKDALGPNHLEYADSLDDLARLRVLQGQPQEAETLLKEVLAITRRQLDMTALAQSERQQLRMSESLRYPFHRFLSLVGETETHTIAAYAHLLVWKGSVLARQQRLRLERQNPELAALVAELRTASSLLATLAFATPEPKERDVWQRQLEKLTTEKEALERELALKSQSFRRDQELKNLTPSKLLELLPADTALVDFLVYGYEQPDPNKKSKWNNQDRLTAFVLKPGAAIVRLELGPMASIEKAIDQWRDSYKKQPGENHSGMELRRRLWLPLEKHVVGAKTILISPDGALGRLPFAALPGSKAGSYLLEEVALTVVPVPRLLSGLLSRDSDGRGKEPSLMLVGDVDFDASAGKADAGIRVAATGTRSGERKEWKRLPGTRGEIVTIRDSFEQRFADGKLKILRGDQATQSSLRELASKYSYLHLATHGFFAPPEVRSALASDDRNHSAGNLFGEQGVKGFHPGLLSGLVFAGANKPPAPGQSDAILTALEVAELDLSKVELAVLSACETGLGKVAAGEGILGLQRAFQVAGAKSVVVSLWSVDDEATRKLMERFYENLWQKKMSKQEAFRQAQLAMLRGELVRGVVREDEPAQRRLPPYYWAAFVLSGDWR